MTIFGPIAINLPILIIFSLTIRHALQVPGDGMVHEGFAWIKDLREGDLLLAGLGGALAMTNAELMSPKTRPSDKTVEVEPDKEEDSFGRGEHGAKVEEPTDSPNATKKKVSHMIPPPSSIRQAKSSGFTRRSISNPTSLPDKPIDHLSNPKTNPPPKLPPRQRSLPLPAKIPSTGSKPPPELVSIDPAGFWSRLLKGDRLNLIVINALRGGALLLFFFGPLIPSVSNLAS